MSVLCLSVGGRHMEKDGGEVVAGPLIVYEAQDRLNGKLVRS